MYPSQITPNGSSVIKVFEIICQWLGVFPIITMLFSFYGTKTSTKYGWVTLSALLGITLFKIHSNHCKNWKDMFVKVLGKDGDSMVMTMSDGVPRFPLSREKDLVNIIGFKFE